MNNFSPGQRKGHHSRPNDQAQTAALNASQAPRHPTDTRETNPAPSVPQLRRFSNLQVAESLLRAAQAHLAEELELRRRGGPGAETRRRAVVALDAEVVRRELSRFLAGGETGGDGHD